MRVSKVFGEDRLKYLANQITAMFSGATTTEQLGTVALEIMVARENAEETISGKSSQEDKERAQRTLEQLREIEKNIVRLYILNRLEYPQGKKTPFIDYVMSKYTSSH
jgi:hypothetical protein